MLNWLKHAFAVEAAVTVPTAAQSAVIDAVCREIIRREMTLPVQLALESSAPLHFIAGQMLRFVEPFLSVLLQPSDVKEFAAFLERRGAMEYICGRINELKQTTVGK